MSRVELLQAQQELIEAIDSRYEVELINEHKLVITLPDLPKVKTAALGVNSVKELLSKPLMLEIELKKLEQRQIVAVLEQLKFKAGLSIGTGEMALKNKSNVFSRPDSEITVTLIMTTSSMLTIPNVKRFNRAVVQRPLVNNGFFSVSVGTAAELINALAEAQGVL